MNFKKELEDYLSYPDSVGALLVTGEWGCGKSFCIKQHVNRLNLEGKYAIAIVSLFGIDSVALLHETIKNKYFSLTSNLLGENTRKGLGLIKSVASTAHDFVTAIDPEAKALPTLSAATAILSFDPLKLISVDNKVGLGEDTSTFALVFDDFERCDVPVADLMGVINEYSENKQIKTIIVADQEKIKDERYKDFKEKLIVRTLSFKPNFAEIIHSIINGYPDTDKKYKEFLLSHEACLKAAFDHSGYKNLRTLKTCIFDFKRIFDVWPRELSTKIMEEVFYKFCAMEYEAKAGKFAKGKYGIYSLCVPASEKDEAYLIQRIESKYIRNTFRNTLYSIGQWVVDGNWNEEKFLSEMSKTYLVEDLSPEQKITRLPIWELSQEEINIGITSLVNKAYQGEASVGEILALLKKIFLLKEIEFPFPCEIDYKKIEAAFEIRKAKFRNGQLEMDMLSRFIDKANVEQEAYDLYEKIQALETLTYAWEHRRNFIAFIKGESDVSVYDIKGAYIDIFDDDVLNLFVDAYFEANNQRKRDLSSALLELDLNNNRCSNTESKACSINNLRQLLVVIDEKIKSANDMITTLILKNFREKLESKITSMVSGE